MNELHRRPEICSFCSLLCELPTEVPCPRRQASLSMVDQRLESAETLGSSIDTLIEASLAKAAEWIGNATELLVTGRFRSVETTRSAVAFAQRFNGVIDPWESDHAMGAIASLQRSGGYGVSLAEAADHSDLWIVLGDDRLLELSPLLPKAIHRGETIPLLLLGKWSDSSLQRWQEAGFDVLCMDVPLEDLPKCLSQATRLGNAYCDSQLGRWILESDYTTVLLAPTSLDVAHVDLWMDLLSQWVLRRNQTHRIATLSWGPLESTFHQACTWLTGFPGRVGFDRNIPLYDPFAYRAKRWCQRRQDSARGAGRPLVVWVDDSIEPEPGEFIRLDFPKIIIGSMPIDRPGATEVWLPSGIVGVTHPMKAFRADQTVLAKIEPNTGRRTLSHPMPAQWLGRLMRCK